jgi:hypothetical protein
MAKQSLPASEQEQALSRLVKALLKHRQELDPWLEFPQSDCCFRFGEARTPLPIGALHRLWETDERWRKRCPFCDSEAYGLRCGGFLSTGWFVFICLECSRSFNVNPGGLGSARALLSSLEGSEFKVTGSCLYGAIGSRGEPLLKVLGLSYSPTARVGVSLGRSRRGGRPGFRFES